MSELKTQEVRRRDWSEVPVHLIALAMATAIAVIPFWPIYSTPRFVIVVSVTFVIGAALVIVSRWLRWSSPVLLLTTIAAYFLFGVPLAVPSRAILLVLPSLDGLADLFFGAGTSWKQLLTISIPVGEYQSLLIPIFLLTLLSTVLSLRLALSQRVPELSVLGPIFVFVIGILVGPETGFWSVATALGLTAVTLVWLNWFRWNRRRSSIRQRVSDSPGFGAAKGLGGAIGVLRTLLGASVILAVAGAASIGQSAVLPPQSDRVVLRNLISQPFNPRSYPSPLSSFRKYEQPGLADESMLIVSGLPSGAKIRIATLDSYDGVVFSVGSGRGTTASGTFTRVPMSVDQSATSGTSAEITIAVVNYTGVWLPTVGDLESIQFHGPNAVALSDRFYFNDNSGTAAVLGGLHRGDSYTITAVVSTDQSSIDLGTLRPGSAELPPIGVVPEELPAVLDSYVAGLDSPGERLAAMIAGLKENGYLSHGVGTDEVPSRSGHSADRITELLTGDRMIGDQEQYAVTAALMARQLGFPARVVFGFDPSASQQAASGEEIIGSRVSAWIEVNTASLGWIAIDPTPPARPIPEEKPDEPTQVARPQSPVQPPVPETVVQNAQVPPSSSQDEPQSISPLLAILLSALSIAGWILLALLVLLSPFLFILIAKWRRRRLRLKAPDSLARVVGGWDEFADAVLDFGYSPGPSPTRIEVAQAVGGSQPFVLAAFADRAVFSPGEPSAEDAVQVWRSVEDLRFLLGGGLTRWERIKALVSLKSLGGYRVTSLFKRGR
ncbi:MAG: transglutaminase domain-containing protein [Cryobacterium sp.]|nr:transglutaminase domain-containing protein [Cryobacterium sp.]